MLEDTEQPGDVIAGASIEVDRADVDCVQVRQNTHCAWLFLRFKWLTHDEKPNLSENFVGNYGLPARNAKDFMFSDRHYIKDRSQGGAQPKVEAFFCAVAYAVYFETAFPLSFGDAPVVTIAF